MQNLFTPSLSFNDVYFQSEDDLKAFRIKIVGHYLYYFIYYSLLTNGAKHFIFKNLYKLKQICLSLCGSLSGTPAYKFTRKNVFLV